MSEVFYLTDVHTRHLVVALGVALENATNNREMDNKLIWLQLR